jgi:hypothetical protein
VLAGDYNVVPTPRDIYSTRSLDNNALIQPECRELFARLLAQGWTDALRKLRPEGPLWTFWDYKRERWPKTITQVDPRWSVIAGVFLTPHPSVNATAHKPVSNCRREQQMVEPHAFVREPG